MLENLPIRLAISVGCLSIAVLGMAGGLRLIPDARQPQIQGRQELVESLAVSANALTDSGRADELRAILSEINRLNPQVVSIGLRALQGELVFQSGDHESLWQAQHDVAASDQMTIALYRDRKHVGSIEVKFAPMERVGFWNDFAARFPLFAFCGAMIVLLNWSFLARNLRKIAPSRMVPDRVRSAFDTLTDGLLLIDDSCHVVMANQAFLRMANQVGKEIRGVHINKFKWRFEDESGRVLDGSPWERCLESHQTQRGDLLTLKPENLPPVRYAVGATPIIGTDGECRGTLVSFHDVTALELKKEQMAKMLQELSASRDEVQRKNRDLQVLASTDSLTGCLNRRSFADRFDLIWERKTQTLSAIMVDIDHFKRINDSYGHSTGDLVLQETGRMLMELVDNRGIVGRYGGEEFAVIMDDMELEAASAFAERIRQEFIQRRPAGLDATMSVGVSSSELGAVDCNQLLEQSDQCLYAAKRDGRNRVVAWDGSRALASFVDEQTIALRNSRRLALEEKSSVIQYPVITAILSALAFRDRETAAHSTRVARLCLQVGERLLNRDELYELEIAALLHDVGKIGVPDAILKKPGPLTPEEWRVMRWHDDIGLEIVRAAFASDKVTDFIKGHYQRHDDRSTTAELDLESFIPLGARILTVCDAFDSMTTDSVYRKARTLEAALAELYDPKNTHFDPLVVRTLERTLSDAPAAQASSPIGPTTPVCPAPLEMGAYVEHLSNAIATGNIAQLREIARRVEVTASQHNIDSVVEAASRLEMSIDQNDASLTQLMGLADEIIELCRSARTQIIENPVVIKSEELIASESNVYGPTAG